MLSSINAVVAVLAATAGQFVTLTTTTRPKMRVKLDGLTNPFSQGIESRSVAQYQAACDYANCVNNQRKREDIENDFSPLGLWNGKGQWNDDGVTVRHVDKPGSRYFALKPRQCGHDGYVKPLAKQFIDLATGLTVDAEAVKPWLVASGGSTRQGVERVVQWRTIACDNVRSVVANGATYILSN